MNKSKRNGKRKTREELSRKRVPKLGYYLIVTDTKETEKNYLYGLRDSIPQDLQEKLVIKVAKCKTSDLVEETLELASLHPQYVEPWIVFDRDKVPNFDEIIKSATEQGIHVGWSNPCIEIWFYAYFGAMPTYSTSVKCVEEFSRKFKTETGLDYEKSYSDIYSRLNECGDENHAIELAQSKIQEHKQNGKNKPSEMCPASTLDILIEEIKNKINSEGK